MAQGIKTFYVSRPGTQKNLPPLAVMIDKLVNDWISANPKARITGHDKTIKADTSFPEAYVSVIWEGELAPPKQPIAEKLVADKAPDADLTNKK